IRLLGLPAVCRAVEHEASLQIDVRDRRGAAERFGRHLPDRPDHVHRVDGGADDVAEKRGEDEVVFAAKEKQIPVGWKPALQLRGGVTAREPPPDDDDCFFRAGHEFRLTRRRAELRKGPDSGTTSVRLLTELGSPYGRLAVTGFCPVDYLR